MSDQDLTPELPDPHPDAFKVLYEAYRAMGCSAAVDPVDPDDCANVASESVRALLAAGLLLPAGTPLAQDQNLTEMWCMLNDRPHGRHAWSCSKPGCAGHTCSGNVPERTGRVLLEDEGPVDG